jgi:hypothetical protein
MRLINLQIILFFFLTSYTSLSTLQTARTIPKGTIQPRAGYSYIGFEIVKMADSIRDMTVISKGLIIEAGGRLGVSDKLDVGIKGTLGSLCLDAKYQFLGTQNSKIAGSVGAALGAGAFSGELFFADDNPRAQMRSIALPLYFSYHPNESIALYSSSRYMYNQLSFKRTYIDQSDPFNQEELKLSTPSHWYGLSAGMRIKFNK